jgi:hypothetical protein
MKTAWNVKISNWIAPDETAATATLWPIGEGGERHRELINRVGLSLSSGFCTMSLNLTAVECHELAQALLEASTPQPVAQAAQNLDKARVLAHVQSAAEQLHAEFRSAGRAA